jgi:hypothetical protein
LRFNSRRPFVLLLEIKDNKLCLKQRVEIHRDVLSLRFDANSDLWMSHGSTQIGKFDEEATKERVSVSRFLEGIYSAVSAEDEVIKKINGLELRSVEVEVDHYEMGKLGKQEIKRKDEIETARKLELRKVKQKVQKNHQEEAKAKKEEEVKRKNAEKEEIDAANKKQKL